MKRTQAIRALAVTPLLLVTGTAILAPDTALAQPQQITFETPAVADPIHAYGEPDIGVNPVSGHVFVSGPAGTGQQRSVWNGSTDGGHTYRLISPAPPSAITGIPNQPGGGDTDIAFDHTGKQYFSDLYALSCFRMATTPDDGATVSQNIYPGGCAGTISADRQWFAVWDPALTGAKTESAYKGPWPLEYFVYNGTAEWTKSTDGLNWSKAVKSGGNPFGPDGYPAVDQVTGKVFEAAGSGTKLLLNIGTPDADGNLTFLDDPPAGAAGLIHIADSFPAQPGATPDDLFSVLSMDSARNLWVVTGLTGSKGSDYQVYVSVASAKSGWKQWAKPVQVSRPPSMTNIFTWLKAGGPGRADAAWYGSDLSGDPSTPIGQKWNVFMSQVVWPVDADGAVVTSAKPQVDMVKVSPHPMKYDDVCLNGTGCLAVQGNRNLADFFVITVDKTGAAEIVYDDTSNGLLQRGAPTSVQVADHAGGPIVTVARQASGPGLFGNDLSGPMNTPVKGITGKAGNARYTVGSTSNSLIDGSQVPGMDVIGTSMAMTDNFLTITVKVVDMRTAAVTAAAVGAPLQQYVTRWQMGDTIYYGAMEMTAAGVPIFYSGPATSTDLCSVSACEPHVINYPEPPSGTLASGMAPVCPAAPSEKDPCTYTINVPLGSVGNPTSKSLLEEIGTYAFAASQPSIAISNAQGQVDNLPLEIGGVCCFNFEAAYRPSPITLPSVSSSASAAAGGPSKLPTTGTGGGSSLLLGALTMFALGCGILTLGRPLRRRGRP